MCVCATDVTSACLRRSSLCGTVSPACNIGSGQLHVYIAPIHVVRYATPSGSALRPQAALNQSYLLTSLHNMEGSRSFMQLYKHQYQLHGMLIKNGLGWGWVWLQEQLNTQRLLVGRGLDAKRPWQAREKLMTYDRVPPAHYELLRGNLQKRERDSAVSQRRCHEGGSSQGVSGRRRDSAVSQCRGHEGGSSLPRWTLDATEGSVRLYDHEYNNEWKENWNCESAHLTTEELRTA